MSDLYDRIVSQRGQLYNLLQRIPGYKGYKEMHDRRTADMILRDHVAGELKKRLDRFASIEKSMVEDGALTLMSKTRDAKAKLQLYHDRVKAAAPGYSGFYAAIEIGEAELEKLYSFDEAQVRYLDGFDDALEKLEQAAGANESVEDAIRTVADIADEANQAFLLREDVLTNLNKTH